MIIWPRNLYLDLSPLEFSSLILSASSNNPNAPKDIETKLAEFTPPEQPSLLEKPDVQKNSLLGKEE